MQAQPQGCLPTERPETSVLPCDRCLWSWMGSPQPLCPCPSGYRTPGLIEIVVRPFPWLHPGSRTVSLQEGAAGGTFLAGLVVGGNGGRGVLMLGVAGPGGAGECSISSSSQFLAAMSRGPASPMGLARGRVACSRLNTTCSTSVFVNAATNKHFAGSLPGGQG